MKNLLSVAALMLLFITSQAQVKFNLELLPDNETYLVSVVAEKTYATPRNMVASTQVVLRYNTDENFIPVIETQIPGLTWSDNAQLDHNAVGSNTSFVCIALVEKASKLITFTKDQATPLFTFKNADGTCPGPIALVENTDADVQQCRAMGYNVTQHMSILGARGEAYAGVVNKEVDCTSSTSDTKETSISKIASVEVMPSPAETEVTINWENQIDFSKELNIVLTDPQGKEVKRVVVQQNKGKNTTTLDVRTWDSGLYQFFFRNEEQKVTKAYRFVVMH